jgi:NNP family nitrate/nitrite transporter-like MFS transporter
MSAMIFLAMYGRVVLSPLLVFIQEDLAIGPARATQLYLPMSLAYSVAMLVSGFIAARWGHRSTISLSAVIMGLGLAAIAVGRNLVVMHLAFGLIGAGAGLYPPSGVASLTAMVDDSIRGRAIAIHESGPNTAFVVAPLIVAGIVLVAGWRWVPGLSAVAAFLLALGFHRFSKAGGFQPEKPHLDNLRAIFRQREFWAITVFFSLAASSTLGVFSILPTFLIGVEGYDQGLVNTLLSVSRVSGIVMVFTSGFLVDRVGVRRLIGAVMAITGAITLGIGVLTGTAMLAAVFLQPIIITAFFPAAVSAMADLGPPKVRNVAVSVMIPTVNLVSSGIFPPVMGALTEQGLVRWGFAGLGAAMLVSLVLLPLLAGRGSATPPAPEKSPAPHQTNTGSRS